MRKIMKIIKSLKILIINFFILCFFIQLPISAKYCEKMENIKVNSNIAEPIIKLEILQETIQTEINKKSEVKEYYFIIRNYEIDNLNNKKISEVSFSYNMEFHISDNSFPVKYKLYDCNTNQEILIQDGKSNNIEIIKNIEYERKYKVVVIWNSLEQMGVNADIDISVNFDQIKK